MRILGTNATYSQAGRKSSVLARETQFGVQPAFSIPANADPAIPFLCRSASYGGGGNTQRGFPKTRRDRATC